MRFGILFLIGGIFLAAIGGLIIKLSYDYRHGELADKRGWSVLQEMDDPRPDVSSGTVLLKRGEFAVLGFRGTGEMKGGPVYGRQSQWSWVLLNEHDADGKFKQLPEFRSYELPCSELMRVEHTVPDVDAYAIKHLRTICRQG